MKKKLLLICMLLLCISIIPSKTFAQNDPGDAGNYVKITNPPAYVLNCKRNNGNGTSAGLADVRLYFSDNNFHNVYLLGIKNSDGTLFANAVLDNFGVFQRGYISYALYFNIPPVNKLLFYFRCDEGYFWIAES